MTSSAWALKAAIKEALETDPSLAALIGEPARLYDRVPQGAVMPYVTFGDWRTEELDTDDARIDAHTFTVVVWSNYAGLKEAKAIAALIEAALHGALLDLEDHTLVDLSFIGAVFGQDEKESVSEAVLRFRALTQNS